MAEENTKAQEVTQEVIDLVIARLKTTPPHISISVGGVGTFTVDQVIGHVRANDEIGKTIAQVQLNYLRSLKDLGLESNDEEHSPLGDETSS